LITNATIAPAEIKLHYASAATTSAEVAGAGTPIAIGINALRDGRYNVNVGRDAILHDDGTMGDAAANDGIFTNDAILHGPVEARDDDTGPRTILFQAEFETSDGLRRAIAIAIAIDRRCYGLWAARLTICCSIRQAKATKCNPATVSGKRS